MKYIIMISLALLSLANNAAGQVTLSLTVKPPYSSHLSDYRHLENRAVITLVNTSATALQVKLVGSLVNESNGLSIQTNSDYRPSVPITIAPHGTTTVTANPGAMNFLDESHTTTNASDAVKQDIITTGLLPEGMYRLCVDIVDYNTNTLLSAHGQGCSTFNISQAQPPAITYPMNGQTIPANQTAINFSWTPPVGNLAGTSVKYRLVVVEVLPGQNPNDAIGTARDFGANNPVLNKTSLLAQTYVAQPSDLKFIAGHTYAAQVIASDANNLLSFLNNGQSPVNVFQCGGGGGVIAGDNKIAVKAGKINISSTVTLPMIDELCKVHYLEGKLQLTFFIHYNYAGGSTIGVPSDSKDPAAQVSVTVTMDKDGHATANYNHWENVPDGADTYEITEIQASRTDKKDLCTSGELCKKNGCVPKVTFTPEKPSAKVGKQIKLDIKIRCDCQ